MGLRCCMGISRASEHVHIYITSGEECRGEGAAHLWQRRFVYLVPVFCSQTRRGANRKRNFGANTCAPPSSFPGGSAPPNTTTPDTRISGHATLSLHLLRPARRSSTRRGPPLVLGDSSNTARGAPRGTG